MNKKLSEMSLQELWQLFPIVLTKPKDCWQSWFDEEAENLAKILPSASKISHIGSTAIKTIWAKPIVDILVEVPREVGFREVKELLLENGYLCMSESKNRISFNKGYTENGFAEKVFHLHLRVCGDNDELYFRDYLIENQEIAKDYESLKLGLWKTFEHNRDAYTEAKTEFIKRYTAIAKTKFANKY